MNLGEKIKYYRKSLGLSQEELGEKCNLSRNAIYNYENNKRTPNLDILSGIASALNVKLSNFIDDNETLTNKLIKVFEKVICDNSINAQSSLELLCELIDIDIDVLNKIIRDSEDLSESYLIRIIDLIYKDNPDEFYKFYKENKHLIADRYLICYQKCEDLIGKRNNYFANKSAENLYPVKQSNPLSESINYIQQSAIENSKQTPNLHKIVFDSIMSSLNSLNELTNNEDYQKTQKIIEDLDSSISALIKTIANKNNIEINDSQIEEIILKVYDLIDFEVFKIGKSKK